MCARARDRHDQAVFIARQESMHDRILALFFAPVLKSDMLGKAHAVPHSAMDLMEFIHEFLIEFQACIDLLGKRHRIGASDLRICVILCRKKPHLLHIEVRHQRQIYEFIEAVCHIRLKLAGLLSCTRC